MLREILRSAENQSQNQSESYSKGIPPTELNSPSSKATALPTGERRPLNEFTHAIGLEADNDIVELPEITGRAVPVKHSDATKFKPLPNKVLQPSTVKGTDSPEFIAAIDLDEPTPVVMELSAVATNKARFGSTPAILVSIPVRDYSSASATAIMTADSSTRATLEIKVEVKESDSDQLAKLKSLIDEHRSRIARLIQEIDPFSHATNRWANYIISNTYIDDYFSQSLQAKFTKYPYDENLQKLKIEIETHNTLIQEYKTLITSRNISSDAYFHPLECRTSSFSRK